VCLSLPLFVVFAAAPVIAYAVGFLIVIPQRSGGICNDP
jgi:hypothetical protein